MAVNGGSGPLRDALEHLALADQRLSMTRHDLRNHLGTIRNAAFYVQKRIGQSELAGDARLREFLKLIDDEIVAANGLVDGVGVAARGAPAAAAAAPAGGAPSSGPRTVSVDEACRSALLVAEHAAGIDVRIDPGPPVPALDVALALHCVLSAAGSATVMRGRPLESGYVIEIEGAAAAPESVEDNPRLKTARDRLEALGGKLELTKTPGPFRVRLRFPLGGAAVPGGGGT